MKAWEEYAFVLNGIVQNVGVFAIGGYTDAHVMAAEIYGKDCLAINVTQIPTSIGDKYNSENGCFYHVAEDGTETLVPTIPTEEESVDALNRTTTEQSENIESNTTAIDDILVMLLDTDETSTEEETV